MAYNATMVFVETPLFTKLVSDYLSDEEYAELQQALLLRQKQEQLFQAAEGCGSSDGRSGSEANEVDCVSSIIG